MNLDLNFTPYTNVNSKWIIDLNVKHKTLKENIGKNHHDLYAKSS